MYTKQLPNPPLPGRYVTYLRQIPLSDYQVYPRFFCYMVSAQKTVLDSEIVSAITEIFTKCPKILMLLAFDSDQSEFQAAPHTDKTRQGGGINFYIDLGGDNVYTRWWRATDMPLTMEGQFVSPVDYHKLREVSSYKFDTQHWYWFDSKTIHSVDRSDRPRKILAAAFD